MNVLLLVCLVAAYCATCSGAKNTVVPGEMTGNSTNRGAFEQPFALAGAARARQ